MRALIAAATGFALALALVLTITAMGSADKPDLAEADAHHRPQAPLTNAPGGPSRCAARQA